MNWATSMLSTVIAGSSARVMDQVLLFGFVQFQTPCGYTVDATAGEVSV
jgi:hypothetical protein